VVPLGTQQWVSVVCRGASRESIEPEAGSGTNNGLLGFSLRPCFFIVLSRHRLPSGTRADSWLILIEIKRGDATKLAPRAAARAVIANSLRLARSRPFFSINFTPPDVGKQRGEKTRLLGPGEQKLRVSAHSAARYATIIPGLANPLFSLQLSRRFFCDSRAFASVCVHMTLRNNGLRSFSSADERAVESPRSRRGVHNPVAIFRTQSRGQMTPVGVGLEGARLPE